MDRSVLRAQLDRCGTELIPQTPTRTTTPTAATSGDAHADIRPAGWGTLRVVVHGCPNCNFAGTLKVSDVRPRNHQKSAASGAPPLTATRVHRCPKCHKNIKTEEKIVDADCHVRYVR